MNNENSKKKPFFASFLEKQIKDPETIQGGAVTTPLTDIVSDTTRDVATSPTFDNATLPTRDHLVTLKYPSDNDEAGI
ncbi:microviridin/marinostatin family tricyclic proteinase inhibitor [Chryseobacterium sp. ERMR1:04]|uniref:microviridin/marinostatin family tricyclic proteinase inhibitor n=1 Tax=Chryseobacterium sp. ERMR1:04 TaxID=1705393 RepID=UPI0006C85906|nr:microviridin/marinostatin family tricyclic proteinase inhibitor [Chryseobacterium sp. ERMR1:04]KPH11011.1 serine endopeptidase [Chryseobacterium sp. ERMR1:04]